MVWFELIYIIKIKSSINFAYDVKYFLLFLIYPRKELSKLEKNNG